MRIRLHKSIDQTNRDLIKKAIRFAIEYHGLDQHKDYVLSVYMDMPKDVSSTNDNTGKDVGYFICHGKMATINMVPRKYKFAEIITLFHEMTHLKQMCEGRLGYTATGSTTWNGVEFPRLKTISHKEYLQLPYEVEARYYEAVMFRKFAMKIVLEKIMFWRKA